MTSALQLYQTTLVIGSGTGYTDATGTAAKIGSGAYRFSCTYNGAVDSCYFVDSVCIIALALRALALFADCCTLVLWYQQRVRKFDSTLAVTTVAGTNIAGYSNGAALSSQFMNPNSQQ